MCDVLSHSSHKARKEHRCDWCGCKIEVGTEYEQATIKDGGSLYTWRNHSECGEAVNIFDMDEYGYGVTIGEFQDCIFELYREKYPDDDSDKSVLMKVKKLLADNLRTKTRRR